MTRDEAIQVLANFYVSTKNPKANRLCEAVYIAIQALKNEPKHGRWIKERVHNLHNGEKRNARECSECGAIYFVYDMANAIDEVPRYCPNCGAKMDLDEVEE